MTHAPCSHVNDGFGQGSWSVEIQVPNFWTHDRCHVLRILSQRVAPPPKKTNETLHHLHPIHANLIPNTWPFKHKVYHLTMSSSLGADSTQNLLTPVCSFLGWHINTLKSDTARMWTPELQIGITGCWLIWGYQYWTNYLLIWFQIPTLLFWSNHRPVNWLCKQSSRKPISNKHHPDLTVLFCHHSPFPLRSSQISHSDKSLWPWIRFAADEIKDPADGGPGLVRLRLKKK